MELVKLRQSTKDMELVKLRQSTQELYNDIDSCITDLINARTPEKKDEDGERKALFRMEGLMVATLQQLSCVIDAIPVNDEGPTETVKKYVLQRADGRFWTKKKHPTKSYFEKDLSKAYLFSTEKSAKEHLSRPEMGEMAVKIRPVIATLLANDEPIYIPSVWTEESIKKSPSMYSWASIDDGKYEHGEKYYDADGNEITKEEYEALVRRPTD